MCLTYVQYYIYKRRGIEMFSLMSACVLHVGCVCVSPCVCLRVCLWVSGLITCLSHHHFIFVDVLFDLPLSLVCIFFVVFFSFVMFILACFFSSLPVTNFFVYYWILLFYYAVVLGVKRCFHLPARNMRRDLFVSFFLFLMTASRFVCMRVFCVSSLNTWINVLV